MPIVLPASSMPCMLEVGARPSRAGGCLERFPPDVHAARDQDVRLGDLGQQLGAVTGVGQADLAALQQARPVLFEVAPLVVAGAGQEKGRSSHGGCSLVGGAILHRGLCRPSWPVLSRSSPHGAARTILASVRLIKSPRSCIVALATRAYAPPLRGSLIRSTRAPEENRGEMTIGAAPNAIVEPSPIVSGEGTSIVERAAAILEQELKTPLFHESPSSVGDPLT